jgi:hypothetical protein
MKIGTLYDRSICLAKIHGVNSHKKYVLINNVSDFIEWSDGMRIGV